MYKCKECGYSFSTPKTYSEDRTPGGVSEGGSFIETWEGCPSCSCGDLIEFRECDECGKFCDIRDLTATSNGLICDLCLEEGDEEC